MDPLAEHEVRALSFRVLAEALARAGEPATAQELTDTLIEREHAVDLGATLETLRCLVGIVCRKTGETPRSVLDAEFSIAPSDAFWRASLARERERQPAAE